MKHRIKSTLFVMLAWSILAIVPMQAAAQDDSGATDALKEAIAGPQRSDANKSRDKYRHPLETLSFFGIKPDMTVVEISPGARDQGSFSCTGGRHVRGTKRNFSIRVHDEKSAVAHAVLDHGELHRGLHSAGIIRVVDFILKSHEIGTGEFGEVGVRAAVGGSRKEQVAGEAE
ncbi:MAG: hypothetical protein WBY66_11655 [Candidatus Acidiferrales bacterium]